MSFKRQFSYYKNLNQNWKLFVLRLFRFSEPASENRRHGQALLRRSVWRRGRPGAIGAAPRLVALQKMTPSGSAAEGRQCDNRRALSRADSGSPADSGRGRF